MNNLNSYLFAVRNDIFPFKPTDIAHTQSAETGEKESVLDFRTAAGGIDKFLDFVNSQELPFGRIVPELGMIEEVARIMRQNTFLDCYVKCGRDTSDIVADGAFGGFGI